MSRIEALIPRPYHGVMVSSTFRDLEQHREALMRVISGQGLHPVAMEDDAALPAGTVIDSSLKKVRNAAAYVGVISARYGQVPDDKARNPLGLSLTELEFREARRLGRPILIFVMGAAHKVDQDAVELDPDRRRKLQAFREEVKRVTEGSTLHRVYAVFNSFHEFEVAATQSVAELRRFLEAESGSVDGGQPAAMTVEPGDRGSIPRPPALYAEPPYIGSHPFVGRSAQLDLLNDWAAAAEPHPVLLFEAIGGAGKSMLTWEWTTRHASAVRDDWAGVFWYSFYEKGAIMADFCRRALAYTTGQPLDALRKKKQPELGDLLLRQLQTRPWLFVLDGLERVLVAYHRPDAAQLRDEQAGAGDAIAQRDPSAAIRPDDDELLRRLAGAAGSKVLITSRLTPRVLLNPSSQPIPGVLHERLPGLRPVDAEALLRTAGVSGDSHRMQDYLQRHCDCHPLVTGVVAGLVNNYLPGRGNFDLWAADPAHGGRLDLAKLDLVQKRNHILETALTAVPGPSQQLLSTLALLSEAVDYATLAALNPHLPPEPEEVLVPISPSTFPFWERLSKAERREEMRDYAAAVERRKAYEGAHRAWSTSLEGAAAAQKLEATVRDLERRGLLQYDPHSGGRWDLHPVVRGVAAGRLPADDRDRLGQRIVDHFSTQSQDSYDHAETVDDVRGGLQVVRTLLQMGRTRQALAALSGGLLSALQANLDAPTEVLSLVRSFFSADWNRPSADLEGWEVGSPANVAAWAFRQLGEPDLALRLGVVALRVTLDGNDLPSMPVRLHNISLTLESANRLARSDVCGRLAVSFAELTGEPGDLLGTRLGRFRAHVLRGQWSEAEAVWETLQAMGRVRPWRVLPGDAEFECALSHFHRGRLTEGELFEVERLARSGHSRGTIRRVHELRGEWLLSQGNSAAAAEELGRAIRMARESGRIDRGAETMLALARFRLGRLDDPPGEAERLAGSRRPNHLALAELWQAIGDADRAAEHALTAYRWAWADGRPHVRAHPMERATALLGELGSDVPDLPDYDPARDPELPWEADVVAALEDHRSRATPVSTRSTDERRSPAAG